MRSQFRSLAMTAVVALAMAACGGGSSPRPVPTVTLTSSATDVAYNAPTGSTVTLTWSSTHANSCTASGAWLGSLGPSGFQSVVLGVTSTYSISCSGRGGVATANVTVRVWYPPYVSITADRTSVLPNETVLLTWSAPDAKTCRGVAGLSGTLPTSGSQTSAPLTETTTFAIECSNPWGLAANSTVVTVEMPKFTVIELPMVSATALNDAGDVVGFRGSAGGGGPGDVVAWIGGAIVDVRVCPTNSDCYRHYAPRAINAARTVIGQGYYRPNPTHIVSFSFVWHYGDYPDSGGDTSEFLHLNDVNDAGQIVGGTDFWPHRLAMLVSDGTVVLLFGPDHFDSVASAINAAGHIAGNVYTAADAKYHLFLYVDGAIKDLGTLGDGDCSATGINSTDAIVGWEDSLQGTRAFRYADSRFTDLGSLGGTSSRANGINDAGQIVGTSTLAGEEPQQQRAFLYVNGRMYDLNDLVEPLPLPLSEAWKINNRGQIIANGCPPAGTSGFCRAYLLTPVSPP